MSKVFTFRGFYKKNVSNTFTKWSSSEISSQQIFLTQTQGKGEFFYKKILYHILTSKLTLSKFN